ncbi:MAG: HAMP domain-containing sensor histidine kinase [Caldilineaceae bacterium]
MNPRLVDLILKHRKVAYVITDRNLKVCEIGGESQLLTLSTSLAAQAAPPQPPNEVSKLGCSLFDLAPEMIGCEAEIEAMLRGALPVFTLALVNRETAQGETYYVNLIVWPYHDEKSNIVGLAHLVEDVTLSGNLEQRLTQQRNEVRLLRDQTAAQNLALQAANAELRQMDELKSKFVSVAAHELRNPLASILGYVELMEEDLEDFNEEHAHCIKTIKKSARRVLGITNDLLDVTRIESGRLELILKPANLVEIVEDVADELQPQLDEKKLQLFLDATPDIPYALCDRPRTIQILTNLLSNALKYTPEAGEITIRLDAENEEGFIIISVTDTGIGIAAEDQAKLFKSFFRGSNTHLTRASGAGLGLSITKSLVELQGGRIWLTSELGKGSTFYVTIPADDGGETEGQRTEIRGQKSEDRD